MPHSGPFSSASKSGPAPEWFRQRLIRITAVSWGVFQMAAGTVLALDAMTLRAVHVMFLMIMGFALYPIRFWQFGGLRKKKSDQPCPDLFWMDLLWMATGLGAFGYLVAMQAEIATRGGYYLPIDTFVSGVGLLVCFELARRTAPSLAWMAGVFLLYNFAGAWLPGVFGHTGFTWNRVADYLFWSGQGLLGVGVGASASYIFLFVLFGTFLSRSGFSALVNDLALAMVGGSVGGPAKVAVLASALMGMINGSALANVATTGSITIPLMVRAGYKAHFAAAVEAVASTGGQFAPPVMGAVGFIMAEFLGVPYTTVMLAAAVPAVLYYLTLLMAVHFEARKLGLSGISAEHTPAALSVLRARGHLLLPLLVLLGLMLAGFTPLFAGAVSIPAAVAASWLRRSTRMRLADVLQAFYDGAAGAVSVCAACVIIGVIVGTVSLTGLGLTFGHEILRFVQPGEPGQVYVAGALVMVMSVVLGTGVPGVAAYVIVAAVAVPVLIKVGVTPLAAHMFCLIYACLSNITPPVAMSAYVAAGIAHTDPHRTGFTAMKLGMTGFVLPFFFLDNPLLLHAMDTPLRAAWAVCTAGIGATALAAGLGGWLLGPCGWLLRGMLLLAGLLTIDPGLHTDGAGLALFGLVLFLTAR